MIKTLKNKIKHFLKKIIDSSLSDNQEIYRTSKGVQILLAEHYKKLLRNSEPLPAFSEIEFQNYSQNGEDGILLFIFSLVGTTNKKCIEICAGNGKQCNTTNLILNFGWNGLLFDGNAQNVTDGKRFFMQRRETENLQPVFIAEWITSENIDKLIAENGFSGDLDLLSLDIDGNDYWILESIVSAKPRVIVLEYQCIWGTDRSVTVPYSPEFKGGFDGQFGIYSGASLPAFVSLLKKKGYRLIGCEHNGYNAFFMRNDTGLNIFSEVDSKDCVDKPFVKFARDKYLDKIKNLNWVEV